MKCCVIAILVLVLCRVTLANEPRLLDRKLLDEGWISLFDGETLYGWQPVGEPKWEVVDGEIRTSGEKRISNFLLWQCAYAELIFVDTLWPDFGKEHLERAMVEFRRRERRYGGVGS